MEEGLIAQGQGNRSSQCDKGLRVGSAKVTLVQLSWTLTPEPSNKLGKVTVGSRLLP